MGKQKGSHQTVRSLLELRNQLDSNTQSLDAAIRDMQLKRFESLWVPQGIAELERGIKGAITFTNSLKLAILNAQRDRGDYSERPGELPENRPVKKKVARVKK